MRVGVAGLGRMGTAIAERLKEVGHDLVVWNRSPEKTKPLADAGAEVAKSPAELATRAEAIVTILTDAAAIDTVYRGPSGILAGGIAGKLVIDMSTVQPETEVRLAEEARAKGAAFVECPVGGTVGPARAGKLIGLAGGEEADVARARPILEQLCRRLEHVGPVGAGASMKLAINLPLIVFYQALGEAYALTKHLGKDTAWMMDLFADTSGGPNVLKVRGPEYRQGAGGPGSRPARLRRRLDPQGSAHHAGGGWRQGLRPAARGAHPLDLRRGGREGLGQARRLEPPRLLDDPPSLRRDRRHGRTDMKLYGFWRSLATLRVRIAMNLKGIEREEVMVDLQAGVQHSPEYRAVNPQGVLPALIDGDGPPLFQSLAILEYLDERFPKPPLLPADARGRARVRGLAQIVACDSHPLIVPRIREFLEREFALDEAQRLAWCRHWLAEGLRAIEAHLVNDAESGAYCHGDTVTMADVCLVSLAVGYRHYFQGRLEDFPKSAAVVERCLADDAFARAHPLRQPGAPKAA